MVSPDYSNQRPLSKIGLVQMPSGKRRTKPWEEPQYGRAGISHLPARPGEAPRAPSSALSQQGSFSVTPQEATSCCKAPRSPQGSGELAGNTALTLYPGAVRAELDPWVATEALPAEAPWVREADGAPSAGHGCAHRETAPFLLEVRGLPLLATLGIPAVLQLWHFSRRDRGCCLSPDRS